LTELLGDVTFRIAPLTLEDAEEMMKEIQYEKILGQFRGQSAVDRSILAQTWLLWAGSAWSTKAFERSTSILSRFDLTEGL